MTGGTSVPRFSGFSYGPLQPGDVADSDPVTYVELRHHEYAGPFWDDEGGLGEDYADWEPYGMTRATFDACCRWSETGGGDEEKAGLLALLRAELPSSIEVESPPAGE
ncbi:hypothetical protein [Nocardioides kribbensis]|uniref:hypothetical protein n=1 Tax=Nocardioides kribbensis TaxID=305517 RepID=UPI0032DB9E19